MRLKAYAAVTHQGPQLEINEDGYDFDLDQNLFFIIDGFGGASHGERAVQSIKTELKSFFSQLTDDPDATMPLYWSPRWLLEGNALINALLRAHQSLFKENQARGLNQRAGASIACAVKVDDILVVAHVGACQVMLARNGHVEPLFVPDTLQFQSVDPSAATALRAPLGAIGFFPELSWSIREVRVQEGDSFVFVTDGVAGWVTPQEVGHAISRTTTDNHQRLNALLKLSNSRGNWGNQTAMILEF